MGQVSSKSQKFLKHIHKHVKYQTYISTPIGFLFVVYNDDFLYGVLMAPEMGDKYYDPFPNIETVFGADDIGAEVTNRLQKYFAKEYTDSFADLPYAFFGTEMQKSVQQNLLNIPYNTTMSYQQFSETYFTKKQTRPVASAIGINPFSIVVPCHRVIGSNGSLTGFAGGVQNKRILLNLEYGADYYQL